MTRGPLLPLVLALLVLPLSVSAQRGVEQGDQTMHTYIIFFAFTAQGIENIKESPTRVQAAMDTVAAMGGRMKDFYGMLGSQYDTIFILEAPDDETVAKITLAIASGGSVRTETHRLFSQDEYTSIISALP